MNVGRPGPLPVRFPEVPDDEDPVTVRWRRAVPWAHDDGVFARQLLGTGPSPDQGWKLHVAASAASAPAVLERVLPVLLAAGARFKVVRSRELLLAMNNGAMRAPQVGKFVTVYPADDAQAVDLAVALDEATAGLAGPRVPTDRPLRPGSLVHYRYGSFRHRRDLDAAPDREGVGGPDLLDAAGRLTVDVRAPRFTGAPPGIADPFEAAGVVAAAPPAPAGFAGRYVVHEVLGRSWRGGVYRAIDVRARPVHAVLLKEFWHDVGADRYGREAPDWGRHEAGILQRHDGDPAFPRYLDTFTSDGNLFVVIEHVDGDAVLAAVPGNGERAALAAGDLLDVARATAAALAHLHDVGVVFRDVKPSNVLRTPDRRWRLVDFGIAHELASDEPPFGGGTEPFASPQQGAGEAPHPADDVFGWGAMVHCLATGFLRWKGDRPSIGAAPPGSFSGPPLAAARPTVDPALADLVDRALRPDAAARPAMAEIRDALAARPEPRPGARRARPRGRRARRRPRPGARRGGRTGRRRPARRGPSGRRGLVRPGDRARRRRLLGHTAPRHRAGAARARPLRRGGRRRAVPGRAGPGDGRRAAPADGRRRRQLAVRRRVGTRPHGGRPPLGRGRRGAAARAPGGPPRRARLPLRRRAAGPAPGGRGPGHHRPRRRDGRAPVLPHRAGPGDRGAPLARGWPRGARRTWSSGPGPARAAPGSGGTSRRRRPTSPAGRSSAWRTGPPASAWPSATSAPPPATSASSPRPPRRAPCWRRQPWRTRRPAGPCGPARWRTAGPTSRRGATAPPASGPSPLHLHRWTGAVHWRELADRAAVAMVPVAAGRDQSGLCHGVAGDGAFALDRFAALGDPTDLGVARAAARRLAAWRDPDRPGAYRTFVGGSVSPSYMVGTAGVGAFLLRLARPGAEPDLVLPLPDGA